MLRSIILSFIAITSLVGCGQDQNSIPFKAPQGSKYGPQSLEKTLNSFVEGKALNTMSTKEISHETIGLNVDVSRQDKKAVIRLYYSQEASSCSMVEYQIENFSSFNSINNFGTLRCAQSSQNRCQVLVAKIVQSPSSVVKQDGIQPGEVYVALENVSKDNSTDRFIPMIYPGLQAYLQLPRGESDFQVCLKPDRIDYIVDPTGDLSPDNGFKYDDYYNNYDYSGF